MLYIHPNCELYIFNNVLVSNKNVCITKLNFKNYLFLIANKSDINSNTNYDYYISIIIYGNSALLKYLLLSSLE